MYTLLLMNSRHIIIMFVSLVYSLVGSCGVGGSGDLLSRRGAGGVLPPHHPHPHPADFPHPLRFNCMDICSSFATVGSLSEYTSIILKSIMGSRYSCL